MKKYVLLLFAFLLAGCAVPTEPDLGSLKTSYYLGDYEAPVQIVAYGDYECEYCARFHNEILPELELTYINKGDVRYEYRHFPIVTVHKQAFTAAAATYCAGDQGLYWKYMDRLYAFPDQLTREELVVHAKAIDIADLDLFRACLNSGKYQGQIEAEMQEAADLGLRGVPTVFVDDERIDGVRTVEEFIDLLDELLGL